MFFFVNGYRVNWGSDSSPHGVYRRAETGGNLSRGDYVCVDTAALTSAIPAVEEACKAGYFSRKLFTGAPHDLIKQIGGIPGDEVSYSSASERLVINGELQQNGVIFNVDSRGRPLPSELSFPCVVPEGEYWLFSDRERNFDSRYFGSVPSKYIKFKMTPVWQW